MNRSLAATLCVLMNAMAVLWLMVTAPGPVPPVMLSAPILPPVIVKVPMPVTAPALSIVTLTDGDILDLRNDGAIEFETEGGNVVRLEYSADDWQTH